MDYYSVKEGMLSLKLKNLERDDPIAQRFLVDGLMDLV
jgi:hypothetical protein